MSVMLNDKSISDMRLNGKQISEAKFNGKFVFGNQSKWVLLSSPDRYYSGNFDTSLIYRNLILNNFSREKKVNLFNDEYLRVSSGKNIFNFRTIAKKSVYWIWFWAGAWTLGVSIFALKVIINGLTMTLKEAVLNKKIEPLVTMASGTPTSVNYKWHEFLDLYNGGQTSSIDYPQGLISFVGKNGNSVDGIEFFTNKTWSTAYSDGLYAYAIPTTYFDIGITAQGGYGDGNLNDVKGGYDSSLYYKLT